VAFILKRVLLIRHRAAAHGASSSLTGARHRRHNNRGYEPTSGPEEAGDNGVWTTAAVFPPPAYDRVVNQSSPAPPTALSSSQPLNVPPSYELAITKQQTAKMDGSEFIVIYRADADVSATTPPMSADMLVPPPLTSLPVNNQSSSSLMLGTEAIVMAAAAAAAAAAAQSASNGQQAVSEQLPQPQVVFLFDTGFNNNEKTTSAALVAGPEEPSRLIETSVTPVDQEPAAEVNSESNAGANNTTERVD
jgi:hypothetical protein